MRKVENKRLASKEEFKQGYAHRSNITLEQLTEFGLEAYHCDCGEKDCQGWQMLHEPPCDKCGVGLVI